MHCRISSGGNELPHLSGPINIYNPHPHCRTNPQEPRDLYDAGLPLSHPPTKCDGRRLPQQYQHSYEMVSPVYQEHVFSPGSSSSLNVSMSTQGSPVQ